MTREEIKKRIYSVNLLVNEKDKYMPVNDYENRDKVINDIINGMDMSDIVSYVYNNMQDYYEARGDEFQEEWESRFGSDDDPANKERGFSDD